MNFFENKNLKVLAITLVIVIVMGVFCLSDNSFVSTAINAATKGLFQVTSYDEGDSPCLYKLFYSCVFGGSVRCGWCKL